MNEFDFLLQIIKSEAFGESSDIPADCDFASLYSLAKNHDLAHFIYPYFEKNGITADVDIKNKLKSSYNIAVFRDIKREFVKNTAYNALNNAEIAFVLLKGAVISALYPESWMRTSCDIDILVHEEDIEKALDTLIENGFSSDRERSYHDVSLYKDDVHIELHYSICENMPKIDSILENAWENCNRLDSSFEYRATPEFFIFHHIAHMCYHFLFGGCGIKPFIDLYLIKNKLEFSDEKLMTLLEQSELVTFYGKVSELVNVWFAGGEHNSVTHQMEDYILNGGVYGNTDNNSIMMSAYHNNKMRNFLNIVFPPYKTMCSTYPILKKHKILLLFFYVKRIFQKLTKSGDRVIGRMGNLASQDNETINTAAEFLNELGLKY